MKIHSVAMTGFGPFKDRQSVDFDTYVDDGIFLIAGKTGSGKTSILDAIVYALYDKIPRGKVEGVRSHHCGPEDPTSVELEFTTESGRYRIVRSPQYSRPKKRGEGFTTAPASIELSHESGDQWVGVSTKANEANAQIQRIVGLNGDQFLQVVLLAQGRFQEFLVADSAKRQELLGAIFRTDRFGRYEDELTNRSRDLRKQRDSTRQSVWEGVGHLANVLAAVDPPTVSSADISEVEPWLAAELAALDGRVSQAEAECERADAAQTEAARRLQTVRDVAQRQAKVANAAARLAELDAEAEQISASRERMATAQRAAQAWPYLVADRKRRDEVEESLTEAQKAESAFSELFPELFPGPVGDDLNELVESLGGAVATLTESEQLEGEFPTLTDAHASAERAQADFEETLTEHKQRREVLAAEVVTLEKNLAELEQQLESHGDARAKVEKLTERLTVSRRADQVEGEVKSGTAKVEAALADLKETQAAETELRGRQLQQMAGQLAMSLVPGEPCAVCGGVDHPQPARAADDPVSDADVEAAAAQASEASTSASNANSNLSAAQATLKQLREQTGGLDTATCERDLEKAAIALAGLDALAAEHKELKVERTTRAAEDQKLATAIDESSAERDRLAAATTTAKATLDAATTRLTKARGSFATVAEHLRDVRHRHDAAKELFTQRQVLADRRRSAEEAATALTDALTEHSFADAQSLEAARLPEADLTTLEKRVREHDTARSVARSVVDDPHHADLPKDPVDIEPVETASREADEHSKKAHAALGELLSSRKSAQQASAGVRSALTTLAALEDQGRALLGLARALQGDNQRRMKLQTYVLAAELEQIVAAANTRLGVMTSGQYALEHDDDRASGNAQSGLGLRVRDHHTGKARTPVSLSGGEKFLASLALALGLAEVVTSRAGGVRLDTLFVDEGFGSLDSETLEVAMRTLDSLREGGRVVGLISHVEAMQEQIPAKLRLSVSAGGWSEVTQ